MTLIAPHRMNTATRNGVTGRDAVGHDAHASAERMWGVTAGSGRTEGRQMKADNGGSSGVR